MFDHGEGCYLYDTESKKYLDFAAGIAVNALGYHYPGYDDALKSQIDKLTHISNLYYNEPMSEAGEKLIKASGLSKAFFTNSGTEAIEGALKAARKYSYTKYGKEAGRFEIIVWARYRPTRPPPAIQTFIILPHYTNGIGYLARERNTACSVRTVGQMVSSS